VGNRLDWLNVTMIASMFCSAGDRAAGDFDLSFGSGPSARARDSLFGAETDDVHSRGLARSGTFDV
jgi:hypothetical protein